ncbi:MAG TPA: helix-turn-helix transcriptional regulator [Ferruginibacter sp.]|nr:helix-turn-helix transcriptional regulator [Ferruginibacter sp.]
MQKIPIRQLTTLHQELPSDKQFKIRRVEHVALLQEEKNIIHALHKHDFFFILALQKGTGNHEIDFIPYMVVDNSVFFLRPGQAHKLDLKPGCTGYLLEFNSEFCHPKDKSSSQRLRKAGNKNYCKLETGRFEKLNSILTAIFEEFTTREEGYLDIIKASLDIFFIEYVRQSPDPKGLAITAKSYTQDRFEEFLELLDKYIATQKQVSQYTHLMNLSPYQLNEITKSSIGKTASELINEHIILEAKRFLLATPNQIKEIADLLGYEDPSYFIRFFRKHTGHSPEAFRHSFG